jgi:hypothetical protein
MLFAAVGCAERNQPLTTNTSDDGMTAGSNNLIIGKHRAKILDALAALLQRKKGAFVIF